MSKALKDLKGIGEKTEKTLNKIGIYNSEDLISYFPRDYHFYEDALPLNNIKEGIYCSFSSVVQCKPSIKKFGQRTTIVTIKIIQGGQAIELIWFNSPYIAATVKAGSVYVFHGIAKKKGNNLIMEHPEVYTPIDYEEIKKTLKPIYSLTKGISNNVLLKHIKTALNDIELNKDFLPSQIKERYKLVDYDYAYKTIHFPKSKEELIVARKRLVFDEFLLFILAISKLKEETSKENNNFPMKPVWDTFNLIESLPFSLTNSQKKVWEVIEYELGKSGIMSRLIQGDVGSGKTIIAFLALVQCGKNNYQGVLLAPTEVLAIQHYKDLVETLKKAKIELNVKLLTGSSKAKERREVISGVESGEIDILVGTHAVLNEKLKYNKLGLVVTDEQHRFGVKQRSELLSRGKTPHVLVMSATPIPRTLGLILYGDLDVSVINELPANRLPRKNCVITKEKRPVAYKFINDEVKKGHQAYIICPMIEESEGMDGENVMDYGEKIKDVFPNYTVEILHGKMKNKEKNEIMESFANNDIQILVSTTVVEVGVNVPNATVMMVENAERFGLASLHQLRGRVGRGKDQAYCIFVQGNGEEKILKRLEVLHKTNDGFVVAQKDLELRGPGDLFGIKQSGDLAFNIGDIYQDESILVEAKEAVENILNMDVNLETEENIFLGRKLKDYISGEDRGFNL